MAKKNRRCKKCTENKNFGFCNDKRCSNPPVSTMKTPTLTKEEDWKTEAIRRFEEHADVHSQRSFVALMKALQVAENHIATLKSNAVQEERDM